MWNILRLSLFFCFIFWGTDLIAQLYKIELDEKINNSTAIIEGKVISKKSFWNDEHTMIYTANTVEIYRSFKGKITEKTIEIVTQGGSVGTDAISVSHVLQLEQGRTGIFFCAPNSLNLKSPVTKKILYDVYSSEQGFLRYDLKRDEARAPFVTYKKIESNLYSLLQQKTGQAPQSINNNFNVAAIVSQNVSQGGAGTLATISSFSPTTVHGGTLNDPANNVLTINGSGFGNVPSGSCAVLFKDGNSDNNFPDFEVSYKSSYIVSWSDTKIVVRVPDRAATGDIAVQLSDGSSVQSTNELNVFYSVLNLEFVFKKATEGIDTTINTEPRLMNANNSGGYTIQYSTSTAGGGTNFDASPAKESFLRALSTWKDAVGVNFSIGANTTLQKVTDDKINLVVFDNKNTGVPPMAAGVLESTYSYGTLCYTQSPFKTFTAQKTGFDVLLRNNGVSVGNIPFTDGPCFPATNSYDREMIVLHELGHALNLAHINDGAQGSSIPNVNPSKLMHYAIISYVDRRSLDASAYQGGLYTVTPQHDQYGSCGAFAAEMTQLPKVTVANDNCPSTFPSSPTADGTEVTFDLIHATSNKLVDPQYTDVSCNNVGTQVTNNAYYSFRTGTQTNLKLDISSYTTSPSELSSCTGQGVRLAIYDVSTCPPAQNYPPAVSCLTFTGNGTITISGLQTEHTYLLYFDGLRNTKASFIATFNGTGVTPQSSVFVYPNPVKDLLTVSITATASSKYSCSVYDMLGRRTYTTEFDVIAGTKTFNIPFLLWARGIYIVKITDGAGTVVLKKSIIR